MQRKFLIGLVLGAIVMVALSAFGTYVIAGTESTTGLDKYSTVTVDGHKALAAKIVAGRTESRYHPLPWIGKEVSGVSCPSGLKAVAGAELTCTGSTNDGKTVRIPIRVAKADAKSITWRFER